MAKERRKNSNSSQKKKLARVVKLITNKERIANCVKTRAAMPVTEKKVIIINKGASFP